MGSGRASCRDDQPCGHGVSGMLYTAKRVGDKPDMVIAACPDGSFLDDFLPYLDTHGCGAPITSCAAEQRFVTGSMMAGGSNLGPTLLAPMMAHGF
jgi:hypothetical protein